MNHDFAVYAEHSDSNKVMVSTGGMMGGWNARTFNRTEVRPRSGNIHLDPETGTVTLKRGVYHITAVSIVTYYNPQTDMGGVASKSPALGGYCRLRDTTRPGCATPEECVNEDVVAVGTMSTANMLPSSIDTYLHVDKDEAKLVLEHQVGEDVANINLQLFVVNSTWHVMARISIARLFEHEEEVVDKPVKQVEARITQQLRPLAGPGTRRSSINRVFNAALGELLDQQSGSRYEQLYKRYIGIEPRFRPTSQGCDPWVDAEDSELMALLARGVIRFGYVSGAPYVYLKEGKRIGLDYELGMALTEIISLHYLGNAHRLRTEWIEAPLPPGDEQAGKLQALCQGLDEGSFDLALTGQMMLPADYLPKDYAVEWTAPTALLFTGITYNGRDRDVLDLQGMKAIQSGALDDFMRYATAESQRLDLELRVFAVTNPGPSPGSATAIVLGVNQAKGRAVWDIGDVARSDEVMLTATDHFSVGDSLAMGATTLHPGFCGQYLNIAANIETETVNGKVESYVGLWPLAGFTAKKR